MHLKSYVKKTGNQRFVYFGSFVQYLCCPAFPDIERNFIEYY